MKILLVAVSFFLYIQTSQAVDIAELCSFELDNNNNLCKKTEPISCGPEQSTPITFSNKQLVGGTFTNDRLTVIMNFECTVNDTTTFHEVNVKDISIINGLSSIVKIGDGDQLSASSDEGLFYTYNSSNPFEPASEFTQNHIFTIVLIFDVANTIKPNITIDAISVTRQSFNYTADSDGLTANNLSRNAKYTWNTPEMNGDFLNVLFTNIRISHLAGDILLVSDGEPFQTQTIVLPYTSTNLEMQFRRNSTQIQLLTGRHSYPLKIGFEAVFDPETPITTTTRAPLTTTEKPPMDSEYTEIVVLNWKLADLNNTVVVEEVKDQLIDMLDCHIPTEGTYNAFLVNQTSCRSSWTAAFYNCVQAKTTTANVTIEEYKLALGNKECRANKKYEIRFPEEMFDYYNAVAIPIAAVSFAIIIVLILAIWRGTLAVHYRNELKKRSDKAGYNVPGGKEAKDGQWGGGDGNFNEAFEPVDDDEDVIYDPTLDGSVYSTSRYSSFSSASIGTSTFKSESEPAPVTFTSGKLPSPKRSPGPGENPAFSYVTLAKADTNLALRTPRLSNASNKTAVSETNF